MIKSDIVEVLDSAVAKTTITVAGWVRTKRDGKSFSFIEINDGSCLANFQLIVDDTIINYSEVKSLTTGSSLRVTGVLADSPAKGQKFELIAETIEIYNIAPADYPLQKKRHSFEFLREIAHLRPRTNVIGAVMRVRNRLSYGVHQFFQARNFNYVHTPIITASDCEGAGEMFRVSTIDPLSPSKTDDGVIDWSKDFFEKEAHLTVSGQLEGEIMATALGKIYTFGPTFRAENSHTPRHLAEFWMIEPEVAFNNLEDNMNLAEDFVRYLTKDVLENCRADLDFFNLRVDDTVISVLENIANNDFKRITYTEAISILTENNDNFKYKVEWGTDLQTEHERYLSEVKYKRPVIVYNYPKSIKPFYMKINDDGKTVGAMDILVPRIGELIGGSEREWNYDLLKNRISELGLNEEHYWWYLDLRKFGSVPHSGFGLGFERMVLLATGMKNIRDVIPFPRYPGSANF